MFCDGSARQIVAMLLAEAAAAGVDLRLCHRITGVTRAERFRVETDRGTFEAPALVLATGGLSIPKMGATSLAHDIARRFGLPLVAPRPGLVPLTFEGALLDLMRPLSGVALDSIARCGKRRFREAMLFTHRGLSGPAILQVSAPTGSRASRCRSTCCPARTRRAAACRPPRPAAGRAAHHPRRVAAAAPGPGAGRAAPAGAAHGRPAGPRHRCRRRPAQGLARCCRAAREGYAKAEVTLGGVDTAALSSRDCQAKAVPGLFVVGEAVDVTGWLGGYNFQWAWSSGWVAGQAV